MLRLKKVYREELLQLAILLSLLRTDRLHTHLTATPALPAVGMTANDEYWEGSDTWWRNGEPLPSVHPKSIYWRDLEEEHDILYYLNGGRAGITGIGNIWQRNVTAYVGLTAGPSTSKNSTTSIAATSSTSSTTDSGGAVGGSAAIKLHDFSSSTQEDNDLTQEDMDLIEILWKQDVDMGFSVGEWSESNNEPLEAEEVEESSIVKIKEPILKEKEKDKDDSWIRNGYAIDLETGEYILKEERAEPEELSEDEPPSSLLPEPDFSLEEALELVGLNDGIDEQLLDHADVDGTDDRDLKNKTTTTSQPTPTVNDQANNEASNNSKDKLIIAKDEGAEEEEEEVEEEVDDDDDGLSNLDSNIDELEAASAAVDLLEGRLADIFGDIPSPVEIDPEDNFNPKPYAQGRVGYSRTVSMEQRWQDLASLLSLPPEHHSHHLHHHAGPPPHHHHLHPQGATGPASGHAPVPPPAVYPHPHHHHHIKAAGLHQTSHLSAEQPAGATAAPLPTPPSLATSNSHYGSSLGGNNIGSAVATSMNLMTNSSEPMGSEAGSTTFKMENSHDMMYYQQNSTSEMNHSTEGFLSSFLNDEDLQLMDMAMNEGMYTMRMLEGGNNGTVAAAGGGSSGGADSDSAVSSMDSERVPSLTSDADWMEETNSDSGHTSADHYHPSDYTSAFTKYRWYDYGGYSSSNRPVAGESTSTLNRGQASNVPQKKHHMYGKRMFQEHSPGGGSLSSGCIGSGPLKMEEPASPYMSPPLEVGREVSAHQHELKYSCSVEFSRQTLGQQAMRSTPAQIAAHNHTYHMLPESCGSPQRPLARDKKGRKSEEETHLTRDERRARSLNIPIAVEDIINLPMDEFNERLSKYDLSENQLSLIRDIRRRGKNKVAAQNCRKRKLDQILSLADEVKQMRERKHKLLHERQVLLSERHRVKSKVTQLYRHIFQSLRDNEGNPYSPYEWSLQQTADGTVILVPRSAAGNGTSALLDHDAPKRKHDHHPTDP
ncbi:NFE2 like bZIP transcription factor cap-n-collar isoform X3 [Rhodnius prolixus]